jgi:hypothetical protein
MAEYRAAYDAARQIEDATERRRAIAIASRETRYFADRLRPLKSSHRRLSSTQLHLDIE